MYVVTFYSYKGGVGRTMALVNTAASLAKRGQRVLVVDFDLEAPSLPSYKLFEKAGNNIGVVDYVSAYRNTGVAPVVEDHIVECHVDDTPIWVMPAGMHTEPSYAEKLNDIDWKDLYERQDGYLFFEDLKQQWMAFDGKGFDYVLIDSRTGHTDVGGICTRHLPDAVSIMFLPNHQNITGLKPIVANIRQENESRTDKIDIHITPSNVPDLDDENEILSKLLNNAADDLNLTDSFPNIIHHYQSLDILTRNLFNLTRPNTTLAKELEELRLRIIGRNFEDKEGALYSLQKIPAQLDKARRNGKDEIRSKLREEVLAILSFHEGDGEIAFAAAAAFNSIGDRSEELNALNVTVNAGYELDRARLKRGFAHFVSNDIDSATADLRYLLASETASVFELLPALQILQRFNDTWEDDVKVAFDRPDNQYSTLFAMMSYCNSFRKAAPVLAERMSRLAKSDQLTAGERSEAQNHAILSLIAAKRFDDAISMLNLCEVEHPLERRVHHVFNRAMASWGSQGLPNKELFLELIQHDAMQKAGLDVNSHQCLAISYAVQEDFSSSKRELDLARAALKPGSKPFSCWSYLYASSDDLAIHFDEMEALIAESTLPTPPFFERSKETMH
jgi:cellulose biosynthesis protein BcsQ